MLENKTTSYIMLSNIFLERGEFDKALLFFDEIY
jgi:hypothetical protein